MSIDILQDRILEKTNPTVAGLDPRPEYVPEFIMSRHIAEWGKTLSAAAEAFLEFNRGLIDALCDIVPAVKLQSAYYELLGWEGVRTLRLTGDYAREKGMYVIGDVKRNDIGSTATAYAEAYLGDVELGGEKLCPFDFDSVTVNPYLGEDGIKPFIDICRRFDKSIFTLVKTSNPSSGQLQDLKIEGESVYVRVGRLIEALADDSLGRHGYTCTGAVVGATYPRQLTELRQKLPHTFFLVPGYGAQGGGAEDVVGAFDKGCGAVINSSRAIICAWQKTGKDGRDYAEAARAEALRMRDALRGVCGL
ncbi:MAG: orotidine-5'-phosphate decarboxylase [Oscillospiraceae bacterium]|nr:orotidine-5'-phosphate decarboxylase [Oscillospiraceae bacterium]